MRCETPSIVATFRVEPRFLASRKRRRASVLEGTGLVRNARSSPCSICPTSASPSDQPARLAPPQSVASVLPHRPPRPASFCILGTAPADAGYEPLGGTGDKLAARVRTDLAGTPVLSLGTESHQGMRPKSPAGWRPGQSGCRTHPGRVGQGGQAKPERDAAPDKTTPLPSLVRRVARPPRCAIVDSSRSPGCWRWDA